ncbi:MAG: metallophosphoesterase family protein [Spirochaetota bacterium]
MKFLTISDVVLDNLYSEHIKDRFHNIDAVLACGDLPHNYIDYIISMLDVPLYFVLGNHDTYYYNFERERNKYRLDFYPSLFPTIQIERNVYKLSFGGINLHMKIVDFNGVLIGGLEGSMRYNNKILQYTESEMWWNMVKMVPKLIFNKVTKGRYIDILITHAPPFGIHDQEDPCHKGFKTFLTFMKLFRPKYLIHGHIHLYDNYTAIKDTYKDTIVLNTYGYQIIEI